jgi:hypothetical protein
MGFLLVCAALPWAVPPLAPHVAVVGRVPAEGSLERLGWSVEEIPDGEADRLTARLEDLDIVLTSRECGSPDRWREFVRYGGVVILTGTPSSVDADWLRAIDRGLGIEVVADLCSSPQEDAPWQDTGHPLLAGRRRVSIGAKHPGRISGRWHVPARCRHDRPALMVHELGDGLVVVSCASSVGRFDTAVVANAWRWARDEGRIGAAREREQAEYRAVSEPKVLDARRSDPPPVIDGIVEEDYWQRVAGTSPFLTEDGRRVADQEARAFVGLDDYWLYAAFRCANGESPGEDERFAIRLDPSGQGSARSELIVCSDGRAEAPDDLWWQWAVQRAGRGWSGEIRAPLVALAGAVGGPDEWALNLLRRAPGPEGISVWAPTGGKLVGVHVDSARFPLRLNHFRLNGNRLSASFTKPSYGGFAGRYIVEARSPSGQVSLTSREMTVREFDVTAVGTVHALGEPGRWELRARVETDGGPVWISPPLSTSR